jgi:hypothetical protein
MTVTSFSVRRVQSLRMGSRRRVLSVGGRVLCLLVLLAAAVIIPGERAIADSSTATLLCQGTVNVSYDPPLTYDDKPTQVSATEDFDYCPTGGVGSGSASSGYTTTAGCTSVRLFVVSSSTYFWDTGQSSEVTYTTTAIERLLNGTVLVTEQGTVTSGFGQGKTAVYQMILPQPNLLACAGAGVSHLTGPEVLTFL